MGDDLETDLATALGAKSILRVRGTEIVDAAGEVVRLRGTNLGGWLFQEGWMSPAGEAPIERDTWSASSFDDSTGERAANAIDGDPTHSWISSVNAEPGQWLGVDLGAPTTFNQVSITPAGKDTEECWLEVRGLGDDGEWWTVVSGRGALIEETTFQTARYLSIVVTAADGSRPWGLSDLRLYVSDEHHLRRGLERRFGSDLARELIDSHQKCWITEADIDQIADLGMNSVRVPFHWEIVLNADGTDRPDAEAFLRLDWVIEACRRRGMYVVLDLHGLPGGAGPWQSHGWAGHNDFWSEGRYQDWAERIWRRVARRYKDEPSVAAYDLINEPLVTMGGVESAEQVELKFAVYDQLYRAVREEDPKHIIMLAAFFGWDQALPPDRFGWTDVVYETHHYSFGDQHDADAMGAFVDRELGRIADQQQRWNVPVYAGEFWLGPFEELYDRWLGGLNRIGASWASWTYKVRNGSASVGPDGILIGTHWSLFHDNPHPVPDLGTATADEIRAAWAKFTTEHFRSDDQVHSIYRRNLGAVTAKPHQTMPTVDEPVQALAETASRTQAEAIVARMSTADKIHLVHGHVDLSYTVPPLPSLGFPGLFMTDGPAGINLQSGSAGQSTAFPCPLALAATWSRDLAFGQGQAIAAEAVQHGYNVVLAPNVDVVRQPWWGRAPEQFGEDPYLIAEMAVPFVRGVQSHPVLANVKHLAVYTQETDRLAGANSVLDERTLREVYLPGFRAAVVRGGARSVMSSFNRVNGTPTAQHVELIQRILKEEWGFAGWILSDYGSTSSTVESANAGFDQEMPGAPANSGYGASQCLFGAPLLQAVEEGSVPMERLEDMVMRILRSMLAGGLMSAAPHSGVFDAHSHGLTPPPPAPEGGDTMALRVAQESMTLLRNASGILPLDSDAVRSIALIGADAAHRTGSGGASSIGNPIRSVPLLEGLRARAALDGIAVSYARGCDPVGPTSMLPGPAEVPSSVLTPSTFEQSAPPAAGGGAASYGRGRDSVWPLSERPDLGGTPSSAASSITKQPNSGLLAEYTDPDDHDWDRVRIRRIEPQVALSLGFLGQMMNASAVPGLPSVFPDGVKARWTGTLTPPADGTYQLSVTSMGRARVWLDGTLVVDADEPHETRVDLGAPIELEGGLRYPIRIEYLTAGTANFLESGEMRLGWLKPDDAVPPGIVDAAELAAASDVAVVFVHPYESEQRDRWSLRLPNEQDELVRAVARANSRTVVVVASGGPVLMPWIDKVEAVLVAYHAGQCQGVAIASALFGDTDPGGRLPLSYPALEEDVPVAHPLRSPTRPTILHDEGAFVGYRAYDRARITPLFPFGHGLSYTSFGYKDLEIDPAGADGDGEDIALRVSVTVRNTGLRHGSDVVQLYLSRPHSAVERPLRELKGFERVALDPGSERRVTLEVRRHDLAHWDTSTKRWTVEAGLVEVLLGSSSRDIRLRGTLVL